MKVDTSVSLEAADSRGEARFALLCDRALAAVSFVIMALFRAPAALVGGSVILGLTVGNVTTLSPVIVRREFGAASFGAIFGIASCGIQLGTALGPGFYGLLHDASGDYCLPLLLAAVMDLLAAIIIAIGCPWQAFLVDAKHAQPPSLANQAPQDGRRSQRSLGIGVE